MRFRIFPLTSWQHLQNVAEVLCLRCYSRAWAQEVQGCHQPQEHLFSPGATKPDDTSHFCFLFHPGRTEGISSDFLRASQPLQSLCYRRKAFPEAEGLSNREFHIPGRRQCVGQGHTH